MALGYLCLALHAHLPFVRHPEHEYFLEEDWLYEAITETYLPLLDVFEGLERDRINWRLTMSVSPTLAAMLADPLLQARYLRHLDNLLVLAEKEIERTRLDGPFHALARMYHQRFTRCRDAFEGQYGRNILTGFRRFHETGRLELITCAATHGYLPLMYENEQSRRAQVEIGCREFERHFGRRPEGLWLPECGYVPGVDRLLHDSGVRYCFLETHGVLFAEPRPRFGVYAPIVCPETNVAVLARDTESSKQVWSSVEGYPGDFHYREFYRDVGYDLDAEYLKPHLPPPGGRRMLGIKYHRITGPGQHKEPYSPEAALARAREHAANFAYNREKQAEWLSGSMDGRPPLIVAPYDAELFGHWWFEGPQWVDALMRQLHNGPIRPITAPEYFKLHPRLQVCLPAHSSWGYKGYSEVWCDGSNDWIYPHLHEMAVRMTELARNNPGADGLRRRALCQAARELLLAQASDWAFIMKSGTMVEYARQRTATHVTAFNHLYDSLHKGEVDAEWLGEVERRHNLFPDIDYRLFA